MEATADVENLKATELRLGLPGTGEPEKTSPSLPPSTPRGSKRALDEDNGHDDQEDKNKRDGETAPPAAKARVVGWPPVRSYRKSCFSKNSKTHQQEKEATATAAPNNGGLYVKVSMDGAPYLRKVDLKMYNGYRELREALEAMFSSVCTNPSEFAVTYEDKDGDLMLVGDVPFDMFTSTCKRLRIMKGSEARGLGSSPRE